MATGVSWELCPKPCDVAQAPFGPRQQRAFDCACGEPRCWVGRGEPASPSLWEPSCGVASWPVQLLRAPVLLGVQEQEQDAELYGRRPASHSDGAT